RQAGSLPSDPVVLPAAQVSRPQGVSSGEFFGTSGRSSQRNTVAFTLFARVVLAGRSGQSTLGVKSSGAKGSRRPTQPTRPAGRERRPDPIDPRKPPLTRPASG